MADVSKVKRKKILSEMKLNIIILLIFVFFTCLCMGFIRVRLMQNAYDTGMSLARTYAVEEQNNISMYSTLLEMGVSSIDERFQEGPEDVKEWIFDYLSVTNRFFGESFDPCAVVDGEYIYVNPKENAELYDFTKEQWYIQAVNAEGEIVFSDIYNDYFSGHKVITAAKKSETSDIVIAFNIYPESFNYYGGESGILQGGRYYLCDSRGSLVYYQTDYGESYEECQEFASELLDGIENGSYNSYNDLVKTKDEGKRGVYYFKMSNGWTSILTMRISSILGGLNSFYIIILVIMLALALLVLYMTYREFKNRRSITRARDTVQALGNMYYAIYRVNYIDGTYEAIKASDHVAEKLGSSGSYEKLIDTINEVTDEDTGHDFKPSFALEKIKELVSSGVKDYGGDFLRKFEDGYKWVSVRLLFDDNLEPGEVVLCFRRIDEEMDRQTEQLDLLKNALQAARKSENSKNKFFNNMSHDMRTPLNAIIGFTGLAEQNPGDAEKLMEYIRKIEVSGRQLLNLINDVLEISRLESGKFSLEYKPINLRECIESCAEQFRDQAKREHKTFSVRYDITNEMVMCDSFRMTQIINNILSNAFKYSKSGAKVDMRVIERRYLEHSKYQIEVEDTGIGMTSEFIKTIFEPYARENRFGSGSVTGTGLGMPIVKSLVQQMSGKIFVESRLGKGSKFTVIIPLETAEAEKSKEAAHISAAEGEIDLNGFTVLVAEDNEINMEIAVEILKERGVEVIQAWDGAEAVEEFEKSEPGAIDAILMDMQMPVMDGCEAARTIRALKRPDAQTVPIIAVSANAFAEDVAMTAEAGMNAHISKPIDFDVLYGTLNKLIKE